MASVLSPTQLAKRHAVLVAESKTHRLYEFPDKAKDGWHSYYLRLIDPPHRRGTKHAWWFGHSGERFARNTDAGKLFESDLRTYRWVGTELKKRAYFERAA